MGITLPSVLWTLAGTGLILVGVKSIPVAVFLAARTCDSLADNHRYVRYAMAIGVFALPWLTIATGTAIATSVIPDF